MTNKQYWTAIRDGLAKMAADERHPTTDNVLRASNGDDLRETLAGLRKELTLAKR
jgi:hypothetical protein